MRIDQEIEFYKLLSETKQATIVNLLKIIDILTERIEKDEN